MWKTLNEINLKKRMGGGGGDIKIKRRKATPFTRNLFHIKSPNLLLCLVHKVKYGT